MAIPPNEQLTVSVPDGNDVALGATTDATSDNTLIGRLKNLLSRWPAALTAGGNLKTALLEAVPAGTNLIGKVGIDQTTPGTTNAVQLAAALPAGTNTVGSVTIATRTTGGASYAACPAATDTAVKASAGTLLGVWITGTGTAGDVALKDGSTTYFDAQVPAAVTTLTLPVPPGGIAHGTNIHVVTTGAGVSAAAVYV